jgi:hypothetical protein
VLDEQSDLTHQQESILTDEEKLLRAGTAAGSSSWLATTRIPSALGMHLMEGEKDVMCVDGKTVIHIIGEYNLQYVLRYVTLH